MPIRVTGTPAAVITEVNAKLAHAFTQREVTDRVAALGVQVGQDLERRALAILDRYRDHGFRFVDATSFALMRAERIRHASAVWRPRVCTGRCWS